MTDCIDYPDQPEWPDPERPKEPTIGPAANVDELSEAAWEGERKKTNRRKRMLCLGCGIYPADDGGLCPGCEAYEEHRNVY